MLFLIAPNPDPGWTGFDAGFHRVHFEVKMDPRDDTPDSTAANTSDTHLIRYISPSVYLSLSLYARAYNDLYQHQGCY